MEEQIQTLMEKFQIDHDRAESLLKTAIAFLKIKEAINN